MTYRSTATRLALAACMAMLPTQSSRAQDVASQVRSLTGAHTRLVWSQDQADSDFRGYDANDKLYGFDTDDGSGIRQICPNGDCGASGYTKPLFTMDGARIVYSNRMDNYVYVVNFDGSGRRQLTEGLASSVRFINGTHWVYLRKGDNGLGDDGGDIRRYDIDDPSRQEVIWTRSDVGNIHQIWFTVSGDGTRAAGTFPWSSAKSVTLPNGSYLGGSNGCWTCMAPDDSYRWWVFEGNHQKLKMFDGSSSNIGSVTINNTPATNGEQVYYPRWTNHPRYMTMCGPGVGGAGSDVYIGKLAADFRSAGSWVRITNNNDADLYADAWVSSSLTQRAATPVISPAQERFSDSLAVTLTCATPDASIRYTLNGDDPTESSALYDGPIAVTATTTVKARAYAAGLEASAIASRTYTRTEPPVLTTVTVSPQSATVAPGGTFTFAAVGLDQYGDTLDPQPSTSWSVDSAQSIDAAGAFTAGPNPGGPYTVTATMTAGTHTVTATARITVAAVHIRMNAGENVVDGWEAQGPFVSGGANFTTTAAIDTTAASDPGPEALYQSFRRAEPSFTYAELSNGDYLVRLHVTEPNDVPVGRRGMDIVIEGTPVETGLDIVAVAGEPRVAVIREHQVTVSDGNGMTIALENGSGNDAFVCGIEIIAVAEKQSPIVVTSPADGDTYRPGDTLHIRWQTHDPMIGGVVLELTVNEGESWEVIVPEGSIARGEAGWEDYAWVVPDDPALFSSACIVRIHEYNRKDVFDLSEGLFTIGSSAATPQAGRADALRGAPRIQRLRNGTLRIHPLSAGVRVSIHRVDGRRIPAEYHRVGSAVFVDATVSGIAVVHIATEEGSTVRHIALPR